MIQRKAYAEERKWPGFSDKGSDINEANQSTLFIEQALQNLGIEQNYRDKEEEIAITCLQDEQSSSMFCSTITTDHFSIDRYPFKNLREAVDVLFLHGASDMVIAKQAIVSFSFFFFISYYLWSLSLVAWDIIFTLFLRHATSLNFLNASQLLYYLFDRHWSRPDSEWRYLVDDFAATFGITNRTLLECLVFCLLDDHSSEALEVPALYLFLLDI